MRRERRTKRRRWPIVALIGLTVLLLAAGGMLAWAWYARSGAAGSTVTQMPGMTREQIQAELDRQTIESMMTVAVSPLIVLEDDGSLSLHVINSSDNDIHQTFSLEQGGEVIFTSEPLAPGTQVDSCIAEGAQAGEAIVTVRGVDPITGAPQGSPAAVMASIVPAGSEDDAEETASSD